MALIINTFLSILTNFTASQ